MRSMLSRLALVAYLAVPMAALGCGRIVPGAGGDDLPVIVFTNESIDMTTVYAVRPGGDPRRLTSVMPGRSETITLPPDIASASSVTILAGTASGTPTASTGAISIGPGVRLAVRLNASGNQLSVLPGGSN